MLNVLARTASKGSRAALTPLTVTALVVAAASAGASPVRLGPTSTVQSADFTQALNLLRQGQLKEADAAFQAIVQRNPDQIYAVMGSAQVALDEKKLDVADKAVSSVLDKQPNLPEGHNMKGVVLLMQKHSDAARQEFERAIQLRPTYVTPRLYLAAMALDAQNYPQAVGAFDDLIKSAPRLPAGYIGKAEAQMMMNKPADALATLNAWTSADPRSELPFEVTANLLLARGEPREAAKELNLGLATHPKSAALLSSLGTALAQQNDLTAAGTQYRAALNADAKNINALIGLGDIAAKSGHPDEAISRYRAALAVDPTNAIANNNLAWVLAEQGSALDEPLRLAQVATKANPDYADAHDTAGWIYYRKGDYPKAIAELTKAKALAPARQDIAAHLGLAYAKSGRKDAALAELKRALAGPQPVDNRAEIERVIAELSKTLN